MNNLLFTLRQLRHIPGHIAAVIVSLAVGMGLSIAAFATVDSVLFAPVPGVVDRDQVVQLRWIADGGLMTAAEFATLSSALRPELRCVVAQGDALRPAQLPGGPATLQVAYVSPHFFDCLGTKPVAGDLTRASSSRDRGVPFAVLAESVWREHYGASGDVIGRVITISGYDFVIGGVVPSRFGGLRLVDLGARAVEGPQVWLTLDQATPQVPRLSVAGRLNQRSSLSPLRAHLAILAPRIDAESPTPHRPAMIRAFRAGLDWTTNPLDSALTVSLVLFVPLAVLGIGCANVINLQLSRASDRTRELITRMALGASLRQLIQLLIIEVSLLTVAAGLGGMLCARVLLVEMQRALPNPLKLGGPAALFTIALSALVILAVGLTPLWIALREMSRRSAKQQVIGESHRTARRLLIGFQIAGSVVLLFVSNLGIRTLLAYDAASPADLPRIVVAEIALDQLRHPPTDSGAFMNAVLNKLRDRRTVRSAGFATFVRYGFPTKVAFERDTDGSQRTAYVAFVTPGWFEAMDTRLLAGRAISGSGSPAEAVINESFAASLGKGRPVVGQRVRMAESDGSFSALEIVGVMRDQLTAPFPTILRGMPTRPPARMFLVVRAASSIDAAVPIISEALSSAEPLVPKDVVRPLGSLLDEALGGFGTMVSVGVWLGWLGTTLAGAGLFAVMAYTVRRRTREIGLRIAVGATPGDVLWLVLKDGLTVTVLGLLAGFGLAIPAGFAMRAVFVGVSPADPGALLSVVCVLTAVGAIASAQPALRAMSVDPTVALRED